MTPPPEAPRDAPPSGPAPYPVPYEEPWGRLAGDLQAVVASAGLKLRELWRRNRQGDLSVPGFWPSSLAAMFWPLLLALGLALLLTLGLGLARGMGSLVPPATPAANTGPDPTAPSLSQSFESPVQRPDQPALQPPVPSPSPPAPVLELDPLLVLLAQEDPDGLIASVRPVPAEGLLDLELAASFDALPVPRRQQQADGWLLRSRELGYERLRLLDAQGIVVGQAARVGSGMVLLDPPTPPEA